MAELTKEHLDRYANWEGPGGELDPDKSQEQAEFEKRIAMVQALGDAMLDKRKEAIEARRMCGIENDWKEDEEFYQSIDSANPEGETNVGKPVSSEGGPIGIPSAAKAPTRSSVFIPLTRPYVDAAAARIADMLLPNDEMPWSIKATPIPDGVDLNQAPPMPQTLMAQAAAGMAGAPMPAAPGAQAGITNEALNSENVWDGANAVANMSGPAATPVPMAPSAINQAQAVMAQPAAVAKDASTDKTAAEKAAEAATKQITDWLIQCQYHAEFRKMLENAAKLGTGILKGPVPVIRTSQKWATDPATGQSRLERIQTIEPASFSIDPRNFFPDPACGDDVQRGGYTWEYDTLSARAVQDLLDDETYIEVQLRKVLKEGPAKQGEAPPESPQTIAAERSLVGSAFGVWYFYGMVDKETLEAAGVPEEDLQDLKADSVPAIVTMINDTVVKAALTPMDTGGFPYDVMPWQRRAGMIWGMGVARQMRTPQRMVNAGARALMDNAGFTSGPQVGFREEWIYPVDGKREITPRKLWKMTNKAPDTAKIGDALSFTNIQSNQQEMRELIQLAMKMAEDATGLPMLMQGQQGAAPDTVGGMTILNNNGSTVLRRIARQADDCVTERHIRRYYHWLLENSDNDAAKGDFQIDASGSTALVDRELANQALVQLAPILEADPNIHKQRFHEELLRAHRIDPKNLYMTEAEKKERDAKPQPPPESVMVAQVREKAATDRHHETLTMEHEHHKDEQRLAEGDLKVRYDAALGALDLGLKKLAQDYGMNTDDIKSMLAKTVLTLNAQTSQRESDNRKEVAQAASEPPGQAPAGKAFSE